MQYDIDYDDGDKVKAVAAKFLRKHNSYKEGEKLWVLWDVNVRAAQYHRAEVVRLNDGEEARASGIEGTYTIRFLKPQGSSDAGEIVVPITKISRKRIVKKNKDDQGDDDEL